MKHINEYCSQSEEFSLISEYLLSKNKKMKVSPWRDFIDLCAKYGDENFVEQIEKILNKIGECRLLDIVIPNFIKLLSNEDYIVQINHYGREKEKNNVHIDATHNNIIFTVYAPNNDKVKLINVENYQTNDFNKFSIYLVGEMDRDEFIYMEDEGLLNGGENDKYGVSFTVNKNDSNNEGMQALEKFFDLLG